MPGLVIENLGKAFDGHWVLEDFSLNLKPGTLLVVLGPSGCGKSTLLRLIAGLEQADTGKIILDDIDITGFEPQKRKTAMVFQNYALYPHMTVYDNLAFPLRVAHTNKYDMDGIVRHTAGLLELENLLERRPGQLSGGQRQRVALGRGLVRQPSIFLLDEPLSNLDAALRTRMRQEIVALQKNLGITMVYVTHDQIEALTMADQLIVLKDGAIRQQGTPIEIYNMPADTYVASFLGSPKINLYADDIIDGKASQIPVEVLANIPDGRYMLGLRPEHIKVDSDGPIYGEVIGLEYVGPVTNLQVRTHGPVLTVIDEVGLVTPSIGKHLYLSIHPGKVLLFDEKTGRRLRFDIDDD